jgi:3'(2'), 5'-bisphosphate nucleotidase
MNAYTSHAALAVKIGNIASSAGKIIMSYYRLDAGIKLKADGSPVSLADVEAERLIRKSLNVVLPGATIIGEETFKASELGELPEKFVLVDPLDGTREFINGSDEFTVNIALIDGGVPVLGCVYAPALSRMYIGAQGAVVCKVDPGDPLPRLDTMQKIETAPYPHGGLRAVASRSHLDAATEAWLTNMSVGDRKEAGSSLKFCLIAQGDADVYPRFGPTMEWDTAAGQAVLLAAGGCVMGADDLPLRYGNVGAKLKNGPFIAWARSPLCGIAT